METGRGVSASTGEQPSDPGQDKHAVELLVNEQPVRLEGKSATGAEIKAAAIAQSS